MEVLGAVASVATLIEVGGKATKFAKKIRDIPESFSDLREQIDFLKAISAELSKAREAALNSRSSKLPWPASLENVGRSLDEIIRDLDDLKNKCERQGPGGEPAARRRAWIQHQSKVSALLRKAESVKANLGVALNFFWLVVAQPLAIGQPESPGSVYEIENEEGIQAPTADTAESLSMTAMGLEIKSSTRTSVVAKMRRIYAKRCRCRCQKQSWCIQSPRWTSQLIGGFEIRVWSGTENNSSESSCACLQRNRTLVDDKLPYYLCAAIFRGSLYSLEYPMRPTRTIPFTSSDWTYLGVNMNSFQMIMSQWGVFYFPDDQFGDQCIVSIILYLNGYDALEVLLQEWATVLSRRGFPRQVGYAVRKKQMSLAWSGDEDNRKAWLLDKVASYVYDEGTEPEATPLHEAAIDGEDGEVMEMQNVLDTLGGSAIKIIDDLDKTGQSALHHAARYGNREAAQALVSAGANVNLKDGENGMTALMLAAINNHVECMRILLEGGRGSSNCINQKDSSGWTALTYAIIWGNLDSVQLLMEKGASVSSRDIRGRTCLHQLAQCPRNSTRDIFHILLGTGRISVDAQDNYGRSPLFEAIIYNNLPMMHCLVEAGASWTTIDKLSYNLMHVAAPYANLEMLQFLIAQDLSELDTRHSDRNGDTSWDLFILALNAEPWQLNHNIRNPSEEEQIAFAHLYKNIRDGNIMRDISFLQQILASLTLDNPDTATACICLAKLSQRKKNHSNYGDYAFYRAIENDVRAWPSGRSMSDIRNAIQEDLDELRDLLGTSPWDQPSRYDYMKPDFMQQDTDESDGEYDSDMISWSADETLSRDEGRNEDRSPDHDIESK